MEHSICIDIDLTKQSARDKNRITDKNSKKGDREREKGVKKRKSVCPGVKFPKSQEVNANRT